MAASASVLGFAGSASAASGGSVTVKAHPTGCDYSTMVLDGQQGAQAKCTKSNGGSYKAIVVCVRLLNKEEISREAGVWKKSGVSIVWCPPESYAKTAGVMTRSS
jgi:hypothetical protein